MARRFWLWEKKRGQRRTGSPLVGGFGEVMFFGSLFIFGTSGLMAVLTSQILRPNAGFFRFGLGNWLMLLVFASLVAIGAWRVVVTMLLFGTSAERRSALARRAADMDLAGNGSEGRDAYPSIPDDENLTNSPGIRLAYRLPLLQSSGWQLAVAALAAALCVGTSTVLVLLAINSFQTGHPQWLWIVLLVPFLAVTFWSVYYFVHQILLQTGIGPTNVEISDHPLHPGGEYSLFVSQAGRLQVRVLEVCLVCEEKATFRQGTDLRSDAHTVYRAALLRCERFRIEPSRPFEQQFQFQVPEGAMHSFQASNNAVHWKLVVHGEADSWPPFDRSFPVVVCPASSGVGGGYGAAGRRTFA